MRTVNESDIPETSRESTRDPWFDQVFTGEWVELEPADWSKELRSDGGGYASVRSAQSAIRQAAQARGAKPEDIDLKQRGEYIFVKVTLPGAAKPKKAVAKKATTAKAAAPRTNGTAKKAVAKKGAAKRPAPKASTTPGA